MCTITFIPRPTGYALAMNRDEQRTRALALPPRLERREDCRVVFPSEPGGGTWISLNDAGACLALINWYSVPRRARAPLTSRGSIVRAALAAERPETVDGILRRLPLQRTNPFRLIGVFFHPRAVVEWDWDLSQLRPLRHRWAAQVWASSGFDETSAQRVRRTTFEEALQQGSAGRLDWLRRLHASHRPVRGAYSVCMHRRDAVTVSYTEVRVSRNTATLRYVPGAPCEGATPVDHILVLGRRPGTRRRRGID